MQITCYVCRATVPKEFAHEHHERPQAAGGTDADLIFLCAGCHSNVHQVASMLATARASRAEDVIRSFSVYGQSLPSQRRCMELAREVHLWFEKKKSGHIRLDPDLEAVFEISLPPRVKAALQQEAKLVKDPKSKRSIGMARLASAIVSDWVYRKYPDLKKPPR